MGIIVIIVIVIAIVIIIVIYYRPISIRTSYAWHGKLSWIHCHRNYHRNYHHHYHHHFNHDCNHHCHHHGCKSHLQQQGASRASLSLFLAHRAGLNLSNIDHHGDDDLDDQDHDDDDYLDYDGDGRHLWQPVHFQDFRSWTRRLTATPDDGGFQTPRNLFCHLVGFGHLKIYFGRFWTP